jgi:predicted RNA methylase
MSNDISHFYLIDAFLRPDVEGKVIDLGCGRGNHFPFSESVIGLDINKENLVSAKKGL